MKNLIISVVEGANHSHNVALYVCPWSPWLPVWPYVSVARKYRGDNVPGGKKVGIGAR